MLALYLKKPLTLERYRSGPAGPHLDQFTDWLEARGYQPCRIHHLLHGLHHFSLWAQGAGLSSQELDAKALEAFRHALQRQKRLRYPNGNHSHLFVGARHFVMFLETTGRLTPLESIQLAASALASLTVRSSDEPRASSRTVEINETGVMWCDASGRVGHIPSMQAVTEPSIHRRTTRYIQYINIYLYIHKSQDILENYEDKRVKTGHSHNRPEK